MDSSPPWNQNQGEDEEDEEANASAISLLVLRRVGRRFPVAVASRVASRRGRRHRVQPVADRGNERDDQNDEERPQKHRSLNLLQGGNHCCDVAFQPWQHRHAHHCRHQEQRHCWRRIIVVDVGGAASGSHRRCLLLLTVIECEWFSTVRIAQRTSREGTRGSAGRGPRGGRKQRR